MKTVYAVRWLEVEFGWGDRPEGYKLFLNLDLCLKDTKACLVKGNYKGGYCGPERPAFYVEVPFDSLEEKFQKALDEGGESCSVFTDNHWSPKFQSSPKYVTNETR